MIKRKSGSITNIGSIFGHVTKVKDPHIQQQSLDYKPEKTASLDLAKYGVLVNSVCPGLVKMT